MVIAQHIARAAGSRLLLLREAAGRICVANSHRAMLSKHTLRFDKITPSGHKIKLPWRRMPGRARLGPAIHAFPATEKAPLAPGDQGHGPTLDLCEQTKYKTTI